MDEIFFRTVDQANILGQIFLFLASLSNNDNHSSLESLSVLYFQCINWRIKRKGTFNNFIIKKIEN